MKTEKSFSIALIILLVISVCIPIVNAAETAQETSNSLSVSYYTHIQDIGWEEKYIHKDGEQAGTTGKGKPIEAIAIKADNLPKGVNIRYKAHVRDIGWQGWKKNGEQAGTTGQAKSIEAIQIELQNTTDYIIEYRAHVSYGGWQNWVRDGEMAGTTGQARPIEAIQIRILKRNNSVIYQAHVSYEGWHGWVADGKQAGTTGKGLPIESLKIDVKGYDNMKIEYQAHVQNIGWQNWIQNGEVAGTTGKGLPIEALKIRIKNTDDYSIQYRAHVKNIGWQNWVRDGEMAGTTGKAFPIEAIQIKIVAKTDEMKVSMCNDNPAGDIETYETTMKVRGWVMTSLEGTKIDVKVDGKSISNINELKRVERPDVIAAIQGYGGIEKNPKPGYEVNVDFSKYGGVGTHTLAIQVLSKDGKVLKQETKKVKIIGTYGSSGLTYKGDSRGSKLQYYKFGSGPNVLFATFTVHGFEDKWNNDGAELVTIANDFYNRLENGNYNDIAQKWTVYIFPEVNPDGRRHGTTKDGPGRTTLFSQAPGNKGIDLNRSWQIAGVPFQVNTTNRNYTGTTGFQAYEAKALRDFMLNNQSTSSQTVVVDLHGWTNQLIGDNDICMNYYNPRFPNADKSSLGRYGTGYLVNWARSTLRSSRANARSVLIELPSSGINSHQDVLNQNLSNKYIDSTIAMLRGISVPVSKARSATTVKEPINIDSNMQYKTALAGMIKQEKPMQSEIETIVAKEKEQNGIWISESSRDKIVALMNSFTKQKYKIDENGYLEVEQKSETKNIYDNQIEKAMNSKIKYIVDMSGNYYFIDHMTGTIENNTFENMDAYQIGEYVETDNKKAIILTSNSKNKLTNKEIFEAFIEYLK